MVLVLARIASGCKRRSIGDLVSGRYGVVGQPKRRPALAHLVQEVLGRNDFRTAGGQEEQPNAMQKLAP